MPRTIRLGAMLALFAALLAFAVRTASVETTADDGGAAHSAASPVHASP